MYAVLDYHTSQRWLKRPFSNLNLMACIDILMYLGFRSRAGLKKRLGWHIECRHFYDILTLPEQTISGVWKWSKYLADGLVVSPKWSKNTRLKPSQTTKQSSDTRTFRSAPCELMACLVHNPMSVYYSCKIESPKRGLTVLTQKHIADLQDLSGTMEKSCTDGWNTLKPHGMFTK